MGLSSRTDWPSYVIVAGWVAVFFVMPFVCVVTNTSPGDWLEAIGRWLPG